MSNKRKITITLTEEGLKAILLEKFDFPEDSKLSFETEEERVYSKYDDPRDPPNYKTVVTGIIITHEDKT